MAEAVAPRCTRCGRFTTEPGVFVAHPILDIEYRHCATCQAGLEQAND